MKVKLYLVSQGYILSHSLVNSHSDCKKIFRDIINKTVQNNKNEPVSGLVRGIKYKWILLPINKGQWW